MGYDLFFVCPTGTAQTSQINVSYSYNAFYSVFNPALSKGQTGNELAPVLDAAIQRMKRVYYSLTTSKDVLKALPGNYVQVLTLLHAYAKDHPTWIFHCD